MIMAQLIDTNINGTLSVSGNINSDGDVTLNGLQLTTNENNERELTDSNGNSVLIPRTGKGNTAIGYDNYSGAIGNTNIYGDTIYMYSNNRVYTNGSIVIPNGSGFQAYKTDGTYTSLGYISTSDNAVYASGAVNNVYLGYANDNTYLRTKDFTLRMCPPDVGSTTNDGYFFPVADGTVSLGTTAHRWSKVFATTSTVSTSDEREKSDITAIADYPVTYSRDGSGNVFEKLFNKLTPKTYTLNTEGTNELHIGFIAQDIANSMEELGLSEDDLGLISHDYWTDEETGEEKDRYGLAYAEFIALNTHMLQKQQVKIEEQQVQIADLEERLVQLEKLVNAK